MSHSGHTSARQKALAQQVNLSLRRWQACAQQYVEAGFFTIKHISYWVTEYHRNYLVDETPDEFVRRLQSCEGMDVCVGLHWVACDETKDGGTGQFSASGIWPIKGEKNEEQVLYRARRKMKKLKHFAVDTGDARRDKPATYKRLNQSADVQPAIVYDDQSQNQSKASYMAEQPSQNKPPPSNREVRLWIEGGENHLHVDVFTPSDGKYRQSVPVKFGGPPTRLNRRIISLNRV
jgi:hypothetical protein